LNSCSNILTINTLRRFQVLRLGRAHTPGRISPASVESSAFPAILSCVARLYSVIQLKSSPPRPATIRLFIAAFLLILAQSSAPVLAAGKRGEAPMLAKRVAAGQLPPVEDRLPENPAVVAPVERIGKYGGTWRRLAKGSADVAFTSRLGYEPIVRWDSSGRKVIPGFAESWDIRDGGRTYSFKLRKGMKWSDGQPVTSEDFMFWFEDVISNTDLSPVFPSWLKVGGEIPAVAAPDPWTIEFTFAAPYGIFLETLAFQGNIIAPKHYLKQFHPKYGDMAAINAKAKSMELDYWYQLYGRMADLNDNAELPTWKAFKLKTQPPAPLLIAERNPYYWKVDPEGNQLPYIDQIAFKDLQNGEIITLKAMAGEADFQDRRIDSANFPLFMENSQRRNYRVLRDVSPTTVALYVNQYSKDPALRPILQDRRFRVALSHAVNRKELIFLLYANRAVASRAVASPQDPYYLPEFEKKYLEYDPKLAEELLDQVGLKRKGGGMRTMPDGTPFRQIMHVFPSETGTPGDLWQLLADYFREVGLDFVVTIESAALSRLQVCNGNSDFWAYCIAGMHWSVDPLWYVPWSSASYHAPLYGRYIATEGKDKLGVKPPPEFQRLVDWYKELYSTVGNDARKLELGQAILRQWADECYVIGICKEENLAIVSNRFRNVPEHIIHDYRVLTPGYIGIEQFYIDDEYGREAKGGEK